MRFIDGDLRSNTTESSGQEQLRDFMDGGLCGCLTGFDQRGLRKDRLNANQLISLTRGAYMVDLPLITFIPCGWLEVGRRFTVQ